MLGLEVCMNVCVCVCVVSQRNDVWRILEIYSVWTRRSQPAALNCARKLSTSLVCIMLLCVQSELAQHMSHSITTITTTTVVKVIWREAASPPRTNRSIVCTHKTHLSVHPTKVAAKNIFLWSLIVLANVNSRLRLRSLYTVARSSVCLSSVCNVRALYTADVRLHLSALDSLEVQPGSNSDLSCLCGRQTSDVRWCGNWQEFYFRKWCTTWGHERRRRWCKARRQFYFHRFSNVLLSLP